MTPDPIDTTHRLLDLAAASRMTVDEVIRIFESASEVERLRATIVRYGDHEAGCAAEFDPTRFVIGEPPDPCDCGWDDIEARLTREDNDQ